MRLHGKTCIRTVRAFIQGVNAITRRPSPVASNCCGAVWEMVIASGKLSQETLCSSGLKAAGVGVGGWGGSKPDAMFSAATWWVQRWSQRWNSESESALFPLLLLNIWKGPLPHRPQSGLQWGRGPQVEPADLSDGWCSGAVCCAVSHLPWADWLQLQDLRGCFFFFFLPTSTEDGWIFPPCFLFGDGLFPDSVVSLHLFKYGATVKHL